MMLKMTVLVCATDGSKWLKILMMTTILHTGDCGIQILTVKQLKKLTNIIFQM